MRLCCGFVLCQIIIHLLALLPGGSTPLLISILFLVWFFPFTFRLWYGLIHNAAKHNDSSQDWSPNKPWRATVPPPSRTIPFLETRLFYGSGDVTGFRGELIDVKMARGPKWSISHRLHTFHLLFKGPSVTQGEVLVQERVHVWPPRGAMTGWTRSWKHEGATEIVLVCYEQQATLRFRFQPNIILLALKRANKLF